MSPAGVETFARAVSGLQATLHRTTGADFDRELPRHLDGPAVGAPLPFEGISLAGHPVTLDPSPAQLAAAVVGVTAAGPAVAEYGSVVVRSDRAGAEQISLYPAKHVAVLAASDIVPTLADAMEILVEAVEDGLTSAVFTTGPSATADMGAPVYGAHGPESLCILLLEDR